ncbi:hypothetical protein MTQ01_04005 [Streptomyces sp. XM4193]|uniref:hypothetical protein n=1 Tax=Streptomyces sp. XM4193 TaxID=2929782 RepID=UPI001FFB006D|nr:hypothetical protein [Streptomyces sp. XM4193]MCK1795185.1 hypothetical protein [Streptomyces sp. XM4193]
MRITMRSLVAAATVAGMMAFGAATAQAHDSGKTHKESYELEFEIGDVFAPEAEVEDSEFVQIDQSVTAIVTEVTFGDMVMD